MNMMTMMMGIRLEKELSGRLESVPEWNEYIGSKANFGHESKTETHDGMKKEDRCWHRKHTKELLHKTIL